MRVRVREKAFLRRQKNKILCNQFCLELIISISSRKWVSVGCIHFMVGIAVNLWCTYRVLLSRRKHWLNLTSTCIAPYGFLRCIFFYPFRPESLDFQDFQGEIIVSKTRLHFLLWELVHQLLCNHLKGTEALALLMEAQNYLLVRWPNNYSLFSWHTKIPDMLVIYCSEFLIYYSSYGVVLFLSHSLRGVVAQRVARLTRNVQVVGLSPIKGPPLFPWAKNFTLIA